MVEGESSGEGFADDVFAEFEGSLKYFENLRRIIEDIDDERVDGDYRFRRVFKDDFDGFDVKIKVRIPVIKDLMFKRSAHRRQKTIYIETMEDDEDLVVVGLVPALNLNEVEVKTGWNSLLISTSSGLRKLVSVKGVDLSRKPRIKFRNGIIEIRLRKLK
jgi:HSP20 family molecular chaperone IbpA